MALLTFAALAALWLVACSDTSTSFGRYFKGRTLHVAVMEIKQAPEVRYATIDPEEVIRHYRLIPSEEDLELVLVRLKVENHTATSAVITVDQQGAELRVLPARGHPQSCFSGHAGAIFGDGPRKKRAML